MAIQHTSTVCVRALSLPVLLDPNLIFRGDEAGVEICQRDFLNGLFREDFIAIGDELLGGQRDVANEAVVSIQSWGGPLSFSLAMPCSSTC
jgi:hypothetical protein